MGGLIMNTFEQKIHEYIQENELYCIDIKTLQVNVGFKCNLQCTHCHIEASPQTFFKNWINRIQARSVRGAHVAAGEL